MTKHTSSTPRNTSDHGRADDYFAIIPESILFADVSAGAIRTYAVLRTYADQNRGEAWPSRKRLAADVRCSMGSLDKYIGELVSIGAVTVTARFSEDGDRTSNLYVVHTRPGGGPKTEPPTPKTDTRGGPNIGEGVAQKPIQELDPIELDPIGTTPSSPEPAAPARVDVERMLDYFDTRIEQVGVLPRRPNRTKANRDAARLMLDLDGLDPHEIRQVIDWATADSFWAPNIGSVKKLREKYPQLRARMNEQPRATRQQQTDDLFAAALQRAASGAPNPFDLKAISQ